MNTPSNIISEHYRISPKRADIYLEIRKYVGEGAADYFHDACYVLGKKENYRAHIHIIAHLLREIDSFVCETLLTKEVVESFRGAKNDHRKKVEAIFEKYSIKHGNYVKDIWLNFATDDSYKPVEYAHRNDLKPARQRIGDLDIEDWFDQFCDLLEFIIEIIKNNFFKFVQNIHSSDSTIVEQCLSSIPNGSEQETYLFNYLIDNKINKVDILNKKGFFDYWNTNSDIIRTSYLIIFANSSASAIVGIILDKNVCESENAWVQCNLIEAVKAIPITTARIDALIQKVIDSSDNFISEYSPVVQKQAELIKHLAKNNKADFAFALAMKLFDLVKDEKLSPEFDHYLYGEMFKKIVPALSLKLRA